MAIFRIKKTIKAIFGIASPKGVTLDGKTAATNDAAWIKELRKLPKDSVEEVIESESG